MFVCWRVCILLLHTAVATAIWLGYATQLSGLTERYRIRLIKNQNPKGNWVMQQQSPQNSRVSWSSFTIGASWEKLLDTVMFEVWSKKHPYPLGCPLNQLIEALHCSGVASPTIPSNSKRRSRTPWPYPWPAHIPVAQCAWNQGGDLWARLLQEWLVLEIYYKYIYYKYIYIYIYYKNIYIYI